MGLACDTERAFSRFSYSRSPVRLEVARPAVGALAIDFRMSSDWIAPPATGAPPLFTFFGADGSMFAAHLIADRSGVANFTDHGDALRRARDNEQFPRRTRNDLERGRRRARGHQAVYSLNGASMPAEVNASARAASQAFRSKPSATAFFQVDARICSRFSSRSVLA